MSTYDIVVSVENTSYMGWQSMLLHQSCLHGTGRAPLFIVHGEDDLRDEFRIIQASSGRVQTAPNYRLRFGVEYSPRNVPAALSIANKSCDYVVMLDPDMIFLSEPRFEEIELTSRQIGFEYSAFMRVERFDDALLRDVSGAADVDFDEMCANPIMGGAPYIVPASVRQRFTNECLRILDLFIERSVVPDAASDPEIPWVSVMWAATMAVRKLGMEPIVDRKCIVDYPPDWADSRVRSRAVLLHYSYGGEGFHKRDFDGAVAACERVWDMQADGPGAGSVVCEALSSARDFYDLPLTYRPGERYRDALSA